jgi:CRISPR-associated RAMP protein (TIGR02581 family)
MLKQLVNECIIDLTISPDGPLLIKSGLATVSGPDMAFVTTWRNGQPEVYLPGSSLKGTFRSHAERITRTVKETATCDPFAERGAHMFCGHAFEKRKANEQALSGREERDALNQTVYRDSCLICRLFGSTWFAGRLATADAYAIGKPTKQQRDGVGIDRFTGGAAQGAKFDLEVVTEATFATQLHLRNFELWQLGLVGLLVRDLADGLIRLGSGKSRGLGRVRGAVQSVRLDFLGARSPQTQNGQLIVRGMGSLIEPTMAKAYGITSPDEVSVPAPTASAINGVRASYRFDGKTFDWDPLITQWVTATTAYTTPDAMRAERERRRT